MAVDLAKARQLLAGVQSALASGNFQWLNDSGIQASDREYLVNGRWVPASQVPQSMKVREDGGEGEGSYWAIPSTVRSRTTQAGMQYQQRELEKKVAKGDRRQAERIATLKRSIANQKQAMRNGGLDPDRNPTPLLQRLQAELESLGGSGEVPQTIGGPVGTSSSVQGTDSGDPFAAFRQAYANSPQAQAYGPLTDAMLQDDEFLYQMPNELFMLIPMDRMLASPKLWEERFEGNDPSKPLPRRLDSLPNEFLEKIITANPHMIGKMTMERLAKMNRPFIDSKILPFLDEKPERKVLADALRKALPQSSGGPSTNPDGTPKTPDESGGGGDDDDGGDDGGSDSTTTTPGRSLQEILGTVQYGRPADIGGLTAQEMQGFFNPRVNPGYAENIARVFGIQGDTGNPFGGFLTNTAGDLQDMSAIYRTFAGADPSAGPEGQEGAELTRQTVQDVLGRLGLGSTSALNPQEGRNFLEQLSGQFKGIGAGTHKATPGQGELMERFTGAGGFGDSYDLVSRLLGGGLSPLLGTNSGAARQAAQRRYANFAVQNPNVSALDYLRGAY